MASFGAQYWSSINGTDELNLMEIECALLTSQLLDESHVEDCDDERLRRVIRSLEAEIVEPIMMIEDVDLFMELECENNLVEFYNYSDGALDLTKGQDCSTSSDDAPYNYNWMDMEDNTIEFEEAREYYCYSQYNNDVDNNSYAINSLEEQSFNSLWQDSL